MHTNGLLLLITQTTKLGTWYMATDRAIQPHTWTGRPTKVAVVPSLKRTHLTSQRLRIAIPQAVGRTN